MLSVIAILNFSRALSHQFGRDATFIPPITSTSRNYFERFGRDSGHCERPHTVYNCRDSEITQIIVVKFSYIIPGYGAEHKEFRLSGRGSQRMFFFLLYFFFYGTVVRPNCPAVDLILTSVPEHCRCKPFAFHHLDSNEDTDDKDMKR